MAKVSLSKKEAVLALLERGGARGIPVQILIKKCGKRSPARVYDLRRDGHNIETEPNRGPACRYVLKGVRHDKNTKRNARRSQRA